ncbi:hypothetical protein V6N13_025010 [Hibiscus sabdariffa]
MASIQQTEATINPMKCSNQNNNRAKEGKASIQQSATESTWPQSSTIRGTAMMENGNERCRTMAKSIKPHCFVECGN